MSSLFHFGPIKSKVPSSKEYPIIKFKVTKRSQSLVLCSLPLALRTEPPDVCRINS
jgi:hypothetical protein